ncbi:MAG TPA: SIS domain-containing protein [Thermoanaerobaculia bacterium]|nr:SIS domain-containing protein [Thermoanaerobaculia bacterium]
MAETWSASRLHAEIAEQPEAVARFLAREGSRVARLAVPLRKAGIRFVLVAARGTSDNAARYAQYLFGALDGLPVALAAPSLTTLYGRPPDARGGLVVGISQSGRSPDIVETVAAARRAGAPTLAIVNDAESPLAHAAAEVIPLHAGEERSVAATKTYTVQLAAVALLAISFAGRKALLGQLHAVPDAVALALGAEAAVRRMARRLAGTSRAVVLARGVNYPTAWEIALKLKELALILAEPYSSADFQHGPIALAERGLPAVLVSAPGGKPAGELLALARRVLGLRARGSPVLPVGLPVRGAIPLPAVPELLSPLVAVVPGQLLAFHAALERGLDPDAPRGLRKVTETR